MAGQYSQRALAHGWLKHEILGSGYVTKVEQGKNSLPILELSGQKEVPPRRALDRNVSMAIVDKNLVPVIPMLLKLTVTIDGVRKTADFKVIRWDCEAERVQISSVSQHLIDAIVQSFDPKLKKKLVTYMLCQNRSDKYALEKDEEEHIESAAMQDSSAPAVRRSDFAWKKGRPEGPQKVEVAAEEEVREAKKWYACVAKRKAATTPRAFKKSKAKRPAENAKRPEMAWPEVEGRAGKVGTRQCPARKISLEGVRSMPTQRGDAGFEVEFHSL